MRLSFSIKTAATFACDYYLSTATSSQPQLPPPLEYTLMIYVMSSHHLLIVYKLLLLPYSFPIANNYVVLLVTEKLQNNDIFM